MAGHSHWHKIQHKKALEDQKRGKLFAKLARQITIAAREGTDPEMNPKLREAIERAKAFNMPSDTIERAIKKAAGEDKEVSTLQEFLFEAIGPGEARILIEGITDNKNRALFEIRQVIGDFGGKLVEGGAVKWLFDQKGFIILELSEQEERWQNKEELEMALIESGAEDFREKDGFIEILTAPQDLEKVKEYLKGQGIKIKESFLGWEPKEERELPEKEKEKLQKLFEALDELDDVQEIYCDIKL